MKPRRALIVVAAALAFAGALASCASEGKPGAIPSITFGSPSPSGSGSPAGSGSPGSTPGSGSSRSTPGGVVTPAAAGTGPSPFAYPWTPSPELPVDAQVSPRCVRRGGLVTLKVHTRPKAGLAYIAMYSDGGNGAPKPTGNGYGGNDKGIVGPTGDFRSAFTVSAEAPSGPARVDVIVGYGDWWGYDGPTFAVAGPDGRC